MKKKETLTSERNQFHWPGSGMLAVGPGMFDVVACEAVIYSFVVGQRYFLSTSVGRRFEEKVSPDFVRMNKSI